MCIIQHAFFILQGVQEKIDLFRGLQHFVDYVMASMMDNGVPPTGEVYTLFHHRVKQFYV